MLRHEVATLVEPHNHSDLHSFLVNLTLHAPGLGFEVLDFLDAPHVLHEGQLPSLSCASKCPRLVSVLAQQFWKETKRRLPVFSPCSCGLVFLCSQVPVVLAFPVLLCFLFPVFFVSWFPCFPDSFCKQSNTMFPKEA